MTTQLVSKSHYNGVILLASYVHRLFIKHSALVTLDQLDKNTLNSTKQMLEEVTELCNTFEKNYQYKEEELEQLLNLHSRVQNSLNDFFPKVTNPTLNEKVAVITASFYGERFLNVKIITLGKIFKETLSTDFEKRIPFYDERIKLMDYVIHHLQQDNTLEEQLEQQLHTWYDNVMNLKQSLIDDCMKVPTLIAAQ